MVGNTCLQPYIFVHFYYSNNSLNFTIGTHFLDPKITIVYMNILIHLLIELIFCGEFVSGIYHRQTYPQCVKWLITFVNNSYLLKQRAYKCSYKRCLNSFFCAREPYTELFRNSYGWYRVLELDVWESHFFFSFFYNRDLLSEIGLQNYIFDTS